MRRLGTTGLLATAAVMAATATAAANSPNELDPQLMTPPPGPGFTWTCFETGAGATCQGTSESSYANEPIDMECDGHPVYVTGTGRERATRWHDAEYRATKTFSQHDFPGDRFSLSPTGDGPSLVVKGHWTRHYTYGIPGDRSTRVLTENGAVYVATMPGQGVLFHDVGLIRFLPGQDFEGIAEMHGPHDLYSDFDAVERAVCDVLT
ncbi:MAG TPA: hypothetical protein VFN44_00315 [Solirubrobacteraceae bacterium]|nr:hypothetical protein [Solirubrobacteraceae bacterium]